MASREATIDINELKALKDVDPYTHAGCYELVQKAVGLYSEMNSSGHFTIADLDMINFFTQVKRSFEDFNAAIDSSSLPDKSKKSLKKLLSDIQGKVSRGEYGNKERVGLVGTGFFTFKQKYGPTDDDASKLILCFIDILSKNNLDETLHAAEDIPKIKGVKDNTLSAILHCLKPNVFPIWNSQSRQFFPNLPIEPPLPCNDKGEFAPSNFPRNYIEASRRLNQFREDNHLPFKNWRVIDIVARKEAGKFDSAATAKVQLSSANSSEDLRKSFREWLINNRGQNKRKANDYVKTIEKLPNLLKEEPAVGVFEVSSCNQFRSVYKYAIEWAEENDPERHKYWKQSIDHYVRFLQTRPSGNLPRNLICFGAPGTGKSHKVDEIVREDDTAIRTTFHPDSDYASFVGCYKPKMEGTGKNRRIAYSFVPQAFTKAYVKAWRKMAETKTGGVPERQFLVIEEINRGNCAQIFGDLFQLLDRDDGNWSKYPVDPDSDLKEYLNDWFHGNIKDNGKKRNIATSIRNQKKIGSAESKITWSDILSGSKLVLPPNLYIWATMNTSDQSLFPMDSAFKRRWEWKYSKIKDENQGYKIISGQYDWWEFLQKINAIIREVTSSADKQLGYFFVKLPDDLPEDKRIIDAETFVNKVIFYLWNDVFKDCELEGDEYKAFKNGEKETAKNGEKKTAPQLTFDDFFKNDGTVKEDVVKAFLDELPVGDNLQKKTTQEPAPSLEQMEPR